MVVESDLELIEDIRNKSHKLSKKCIYAAVITIITYVVGFIMGFIVLLMICEFVAIFVVGFYLNNVIEYRYWDLRYHQVKDKEAEK